MSGRAAPSGPPARLLLADSDPALRRVLHLAWPTDSHRQAALDIAAADALTKPFGIDELLQRLRALRGPAHSPSRQGQKDTTGGGAPWAPS
jgi:hypothetical protein